MGHKGLFDIIYFVSGFIDIYHFVIDLSIHLQSDIIFCKEYLFRKVQDIHFTRNHFDHIHTRIDLMVTRSQSVFESTESLYQTYFRLLDSLVRVAYETATYTRTIERARSTA